MTDVDRDADILSHWASGMDTFDIAKATGLTEAVVYNRLHMVLGDVLGRDDLSEPVPIEGSISASMRRRWSDPEWRAKQLAVIRHGQEEKIRADASREFHNLTDADRPPLTMRRSPT